MPIVEHADRAACVCYFLHQYKSRRQELAAPGLHGGDDAGVYVFLYNTPDAYKSNFTLVAKSKLSSLESRKREPTPTASRRFELVALCAHRLRRRWMSSCWSVI
ncbi:uncharacterized protein [Lolium perenne]|uniref:uncharacterized protein n=1 Tax=Lolium perenne TaxID=4522 RepID=UPI003A9A422D